MAPKPVATYKGNDSGNTCPIPCQVPPKELTLTSAGKNKVFVNKTLVMVNADTLSPSLGSLCTGSSPCSVPRVVISKGKVFVGKQPIAHIGDFLNTPNKLTIVSVTSKVFAG